MSSNEASTSDIQPQFVVSAFVRLHNSAGCRAYRRGHVCHSIQVSLAMRAVEEHSALVVQVLAAETVTDTDRRFTRLTLSDSAGDRFDLVNHEADLADCIVVGPDSPYVWVPEFGVLFALTAAERDGLRSGAITLARETEFSPCTIKEAR
jgi:hypothetical protein